MKPGSLVVVLLALAGPLGAQETPDQQARRLLEDGRAYQAQGKAKQALDNFNIVVSSFPNTDSVGQALLEIGRYRMEVENDTAQARALFGQLPVHTFEDKQGIAAALQSELWRLFLFLMLIFLVVEGFLILPERTRKSAAPAPVNMPPPKVEQPAEVNV